LGELGSLLVDVDLKAGSVQRQRGGEAADATTDNGDPERHTDPSRAIDIFVHRGLGWAARLRALYATVNR
jgi:hypothetical protein